MENQFLQGKFFLLLIIRYYYNYFYIFRYGDEDYLVTLMGVMQTLVSFSELTDSNQLKYLKAGRCRIAFLHKEPLLFVLVTYTNEHSMCLLQQLTYAYHQVISTLTLTRIKQKFIVQPNFDLRRWLSNAEKKLLHNIIDMYERDLGMLMTSAKCLILPANTRSQIGQTVAQTIRGQKVGISKILIHHFLKRNKCLGYDICNNTCSWSSCINSTFKKLSFTSI